MPDNEMPVKKAIDTEEIKRAHTILQKYKNGKTKLEQKIIENEQFWKLRHWEQMRGTKWVPATAYLWNAITSKHADFMEAYPEPNVLPREATDRTQAEMLSEIIPVILEQNQFRKTWSDCGWYKLKQGTGIYGIFWDKTKNGIGDIVCEKVDALNLFWQPGITDIQNSRHIFHTELVDNDILEAQYPQLQGKLGKDVNIYTAKYLYDDEVDTTEKSTVIGWYYHKTNSNGKRVLHYCRFCGDEVLSSTENDTEPLMAPSIDPMTNQPMVDEFGQPMMQQIAPPKSETGIYDHGMYPFVFDNLYAIEGSPFGYGMTDIFKDPQIDIDMLHRAGVKNALMGATPRFFSRRDSAVNEADFANWEKEIIKVEGNLDEESIRQIETAPLSNAYFSTLDREIEMLKETSGNRDVNNGGSPTGVTAASAIAALQEQGNKGSRDIISTSYEAYKQIVVLVIELIRQFYDVPRQFRILGEGEQMQFTTFDNSGIKPQPQGIDFGMYMGERMPLFDIEVGAQKQTTYNKISQNELMLQFYNLQFFNPQNVDQALACLEGMDFNGKQEVVDRISRNGTIFDAFTQLYQMATAMAQAYDTRALPALAQLGMQAGMAPPDMPMRDQAPETMETDSMGGIKGEEHPFVKKAREQAQAGTQPT